MRDMIVHKLEELVKEANHMLLSESGCYTEADSRALADMVSRAEKALTGEGAVFTRNREFLSPRENEEILFAYDRYTMAPTFFEEGKVYSHYGLKEAVKWFRNQDRKQWSKEKLQSARLETLEKGQSCLASAKYGNRVGEYDFRCGEQLKEQLRLLADCEEVDLAESLVTCLDAMQKFRFSQKLSSEQTEKPLLLLSEEKLQELRGKIKGKNLVQQQYEKIKAIAQETTLEDSKTAYEQISNKYTYEELNQRFYIWGDTGRVVNTITPSGTCGARLSLCLPSNENEEQGLGHIWVTGLKLLSADGPEISIPNADFEGQSREICPAEQCREADNEMAEGGHIADWNIEVQKGNPVCRQVETKTGEPCLYLCNPTPFDEAVVVCKEVLPLKENSGYTLFFKAKQDGKFQKGFRAVLEFLDAEGNVIDKFTHIFNRKSTIPVGKKSLSMQCNAIVYALEKEEEYAWKAKYDMLTFLNDFCQGAEYWMVYNARPEGSDAYGAVQAGRIMCSAASTYSLISRAEIFSAGEKQFFYGMVDYLLQYCLDMRDRMSMSRERVQWGCSNWQTDMCIGVVSLMTVLPDFPNRKTWLYNAEAVLEAQLATNLNQDGSWPESIRYHHATLEHFASFAVLWRQETGEDWLLTTRLKDMFAYTIHTITPPYEYFDGRIGTPPFGDHKLSGGTEFGIYGLYIEEIARLDKKLADEMYQVWQKSGYPVKGFWGEALALENLLYTEPDGFKTDVENQLQLESTAAYPDSGIYVFRRREKSGKENYLAVMGAAKPIGHGHLDQGSFVLYYQNVPIIMDSGIEGYFDTSTQWHLSSYSHACLQFAATEEEQKTMRAENNIINLNAGNYSMDRGWLDVPRKSRVTEVVIGKETDSITLEIEHPCGREKGIHHRTILFEKESGVVTIKDRIEKYKGTVLFSLPLVMRSAHLVNQSVQAEGYYNVNVTVDFLTPVQKTYLEKGRTTPMFPTEDKVPMLLYVRAEADASQEIAVRIQPCNG